MHLESGASAASVDWLTMTVMSRAKRDIIRQMAEDYSMTLEEQGYERIDYFSHGYIGWRFNSFRYGRRADDDIVCVSGDSAGVGWRRWGKHADNISRLDLQVTHRLADAPRPLSRAIYEGLEQGTIILKRSRGQSLVQSSDGGSTLYVGSRTSELFLRLYDKGVERATDRPGEVWRWEVELKNASAKAMFNELTRYTSSDMVIAGHVARIWSERGLPPPWKPTAETMQPYVERMQPDDERKLRWLRLQVAPTIAYLIKRGRRTDVLSAIGVEL